MQSKTTLSNQQTWDGNAIMIKGTWLEMSTVQKLQINYQKQILRTVESLQPKPTLSSRQTR